MTNDELKAILELHNKLLRGIEGGKMESLRGADLGDSELLSRAYLSGANLSRVFLRGADLLGRANLSRPYLSVANHLPDITPVAEFRTQLLAAVERQGCSLDMAAWHTCETTHCLAGWVTTIHPQGKLLESMLGCSTAAALILNACGEEIPNFFDKSEGADERAMNWLKTGVQANPDVVTEAK